jgi:hypothetical protein
MVSPELWLSVLALMKTLFESTKSVIDLDVTLEKYRHDPETIRESNRISVAYSTYSEAEVESLLRRLEDCRRRFIAQGGGADRAMCLCSVLREASEGNGGSLPIIDDWQNMYSQLNCARFIAL